MFFYCTVAFLISLSFALERPSAITKFGTVNGFHKTSYDGRTYSAFEGIPYAKPPVGKLRFEAPLEPDPWEKAIDAGQLYLCPQMDVIFQEAAGDEDCLYLNVYVPRDIPNPNDNMSIIAHIHGGAFMYGSSDLAGPHFFMDRDIIFVSISYRLGALGFLSTEDDVVPGNNGLKDQNLALQWIQNNIKQFGGNPKSVTITGISSGGASVQFHYLSKMSKGLFHRGISQSGTALAPWALQQGALARAKNLAQLVGCTDTTTTRTLVDCMKGISSSAIVEQTALNFQTVVGQFPFSPFAPVVEKKSNSAFLDDYPYKLLSIGDFNDLPWITSLCSDEGTVGLAFMYPEIDTLDEKFSKYSEYFLNYYDTTCDADKDVIAQKIREQYFGANKIGKSTYQAVIDVFGDRMFGLSFEKSARLQARVSKSKVYTYIYDYKSSFAYDQAPLMGILDLKLHFGHFEDAHLLYDVRFLFGTDAINYVLSKADESLKDMMVNMYLSFADNNAPKINGLALEPISNPKEFTYLSIKTATNIKINVTEEFTPTKFWESLPIIENEKFYKQNCKS